jgi:hypothetical protein
MAFQVRRGTDAVIAALVLAHNNTRRAAGVVGAFFHADVTSDGNGDHNVPTVTAATVTAANASNLATSLTLVNQLRQRWLQHRNDDLAHKVADGLPALTAPVATDLASAQTLANELKADFTTHIGSTTYHYTADATNTVAAADATDQATLNALLNELKGDFNAHIASAPAGQSVKLLEP